MTTTTRTRPAGRPIHIRRSDRLLCGDAIAPGVVTVRWMDARGADCPACCARYASERGEWRDRTRRALRARVKGTRPKGARP